MHVTWRQNTSTKNTNCTNKNPKLNRWSVLICLFLS